MQKPEEQTDEYINEHQNLKGRTKIKTIRALPSGASKSIQSIEESD